MELANLGERIFEGFGGCSACHRIDGLIRCHCCGGHDCLELGLVGLPRQQVISKEEIVKFGISFSRIYFNHPACLSDWRTVVDLDGIAQ